MAETIQKKTKKLLTAKQSAVCEEIINSQSGDVARAKALLLLNDGETQAQTAQLTGLSLGQVRYWLARFRKLGIDCFNNSVQATPKEDVAEADVQSKDKKHKKNKKKDKKKDKKVKKSDKDKTKDKKQSKKKDKKKKK